MNLLQFISSLIDSLAWPATVFAIVCLLRRPLSNLIPGLRRLRYRDLDVQFGHQVEAVQRELQKVPAPALPAPGRRSPIERALLEEAPGYYESIADVSPRAAVLEAWISFETSARSGASLLDLTQPDRPVPVHALLATLEHEGIITESEAHALSKLRALRNELVHNADVHVSAADATRYAATIRLVSQNLAARFLQKFPGGPR